MHVSHLKQDDRYLFAKNIVVYQDLTQKTKKDNPYAMVTNLFYMTLNVFVFLKIPILGVMSWEMAE